MILVPERGLASLGGIDGLVAQPGIALTPAGKARRIVTMDDLLLLGFARARAVLPQEATLAFPFTVLEVALLGRAPHVRFAESAHDIAVTRRAVAAVGLAHFEHRLYPTLSGGERQRVQLARALAQISGLAPGAPRLLLLDEPTSSLDPAHQHRTLKLARALAQDGATVLTIAVDDEV